MRLFRLCLLLLFAAPFSPASFAEQEQDAPVNDSPATNEQKQDQDTPISDSPATNEQGELTAESALDKWPQPPSQSQLLSHDLTQVFLPEQTIELDPDKQITVVVHQSQHSPTLGFVLIQPQWDSVPFNIRKSHLQQELTRQGWHVITLLPQGKLNQNGSEEEKAKQYEQYLKLTAERLSAVAQLPETQSGYSILLAEQNMTLVMLDLYRQQLAPLPNAIVLLGANTLTVQQNQQLAKALSATSVPVLDIYQTSTSQLAPLHETRAQAVQKSAKPNFRQLALVSPFFDERLGTYINGWTRSLGLQ